MNDNNKLKEILAEKEVRLIKQKEWLDGIGLGKLEDDKLANKRVEVRRDISELIFNIEDLKEMIK